MSENIKKLLNISEKSVITIIILILIQTIAFDKISIERIFLRREKYLWEIIKEEIK